MSTLDQALAYAALGWHVVPLADREKRPRIKEWQKNATTDEETITEWFTRWPSANLGVQLGERSGIIDIECDSPEAERDYARLFSGNPPVTCCFTAHRGKHRLFRWRPDLPAGAKTMIGELEVRLGNDGKGAQTVFPPSVHPTGAVYHWLDGCHPDDCPPADLPRELLAKLWNLAGETTLEPEAPAGRPAEDWERISQGVGEGERNSAAAAYIGRHLRNLADPFDNHAVADLFKLIETWNERNQPPLKHAELKTTFDSILRRERQNHVAEKGQELGLEKQRHRTGGKLSREGWRVSRVTTDPPKFLLYSPLWENDVKLTAAEFLSPTRLKTAVLEQVNVVLPKHFDKIWGGYGDAPALSQQLIDACDEVEGADEARRPYVIAEQIYDALLEQNPKTREEGKDFPSHGQPIYDGEGGIVFHFRRVYQPLSRGEDRIKREEISRLLKQLGAKPFRPLIGGRRARRTRLDAAALDKLRRIVDGVEEITAAPEDA